MGSMWERGKVCHLLLGEKVALKQRFEGGERLSHADIYLAEESSRKEEWQVQRP